MARFERSFNADEKKFLEFIEYCKHEVIEGSMSSSWEDGSLSSFGDTKVNVDVFERYSMFGENRVSLNITTIFNNNEVKVIAITSGGSKAILFKINTFGEDSFLKQFERIVDRYIDEL